MKKKLLFATAILCSVSLAFADAVSIGGVYLVYDEDVDDLTSRINEVDGMTASGAISFNASTKTLTLEDATIECNSDKSVILFYPNSTLNIVLVGENSFNQTNSGYVSCVRSAQNSVLNISGSGSLTITSVQWYPIATDASCSIVIDNTTVDLHSTGYGDYGINNNSQTFGDVEIIKSTVRAGSISRVHSVTLTDCRIASPDDAEVTESGISRANVFIVPVYPTGINEVQDNKKQGMKVLRDDAVYILRDGKEYNVKGERVR